MVRGRRGDFRLYRPTVLPGLCPFQLTVDKLLRSFERKRPLLRGASPVQMRNARKKIPMEGGVRTNISKEGGRKSGVWVSLVITEV